VGSNLISSKILDGNGIKAVLGSIPAHNFGSIENKENSDSQMGNNRKKQILCFDLENKNSIMHCLL